jgi:hypothetical protein
MEQDERRKQQLHEIKLQEAAAKANQGIGHKEQMQQVKLKDASSALSKPPKMNKQKLGLPSTNPLAGTEVFKQGQRKLAQGTDTVPAMLTPGEAIIPEPAAQDPKNKEIIKQMVDEGREANALRDGAVQVVPSLAYEHPDVPGSSFMDGTTQVFSRGSADQANYADGTYGVVPQQVQQAVGYTNGTENVSWLDKLLGGSSSQQALVTTAPVVVPPVAVAPATTEVPVTAEIPVAQVPSVSTGVIPGGAGKRGFVENFDTTVPESSRYPYKMPVDPTFSYGDSFTKKNESGALGAAAANPLSSAKGLYQMTDAAWKDAVAEDPTLKYADRTKVDIQEQGKQAYKSALTKQLVSKGIEPNDASIAKAWVVGAEGLKNVFKGDPNANLSLSKEAIAANPNLQGKTNADFINDPNPYSRVGKDARIVATADLTQPQKERVAFLQKVMASPNIPANERGQMRMELDALINKSKPVPPKPAEVSWAESQRDNTRPEVVKEVARIDAATQVNKQVSPQEYPPEVPKVEAPKVEAPSLIETKPEEANKAIATASQERAEILQQFVDTAPTVSANPEEQKSWLAKKIESVFSDTGLFSDSELMRFAIVAAGGMLTGGSTGGSLRYAGLDALKAGDARRVQQAEYKKALGLKTEAAGIQRSKDVNKYYDDEINAAEKSGQIKPEYARQLRKAVLSGNLTTVENALGDKENRFATPQFAAGLPADAKVVYVTKPGFTTKEPAYVSPTSNEYVLFKTDSKGNTVVNRVPASQYEQVSSTENIGDQSRNTLFEKQLSPELLARDKNNNPRPGSLHISRQTIVSQLDEWAKEQKRLGLPDNYSYFASTINNALSTAAKNGENKPHVGKLLSMATINTASLTDNDKYLNKDGKAVPSSYIGDTVNSINAYSKSVVDNNKKLTAEEKKDPQAVLRQSKDMMDKAAVKFEAGNKLTPEELADAAVKTGAVKRNDAQYNKIKEAPNSWWSYINYQMAIDKPKKE